MTAVNWLGAWSSTVSYNPNDGVYDLGLWWVATAANSNARPAANPGSWTGGTPDFTWRGQYGAGVSYGLLDAVFRNGTGYAALDTVTGADPATDTTDWAPCALAPDYLGPYDAQHLYAAGALVSDVDGGMYMLVAAASQGIQPYLTGSAWSATWTPFEDEILIAGILVTIAGTILLMR